MSQNTHNKECLHCPICGCEKPHKVGHMISDKEFNIYACFKCRSGFYLFINPKKVVQGGKKCQEKK